MVSVKSATSKPAGAQKAKAGPSGKMQNFSGSAAQKPGVTAQQSNKAGRGSSFPSGGPSGKMAGTQTVSTQKSGTSAQSNKSGRTSYVK